MFLQYLTSDTLSLNEYLIETDHQQFTINVVTFSKIQFVCHNHEVSFALKSWKLSLPYWLIHWTDLRIFHVCRSFHKSLRANWVQIIKQNTFEVSFIWSEKIPVSWSRWCTSWAYYMYSLVVDTSSWFSSFDLSILLCIPGKYETFLQTRKSKCWHWIIYFFSNIMNTNSIKKMKYYAQLNILFKMIHCMKSGHLHINVSWSIEEVTWSFCHVVARDNSKWVRINEIRDTS